MKSLVTILNIIKAFTWSQVIRLLFIVAIGLMAYGGYTYVNYVSTLEVAVGVKNVVIPKEKLIEVGKIVDEMIEDVGASEYYVWVFQPDKVVKHSSEMIYGKTKFLGWETIRTYHWCKTYMGLYEIPEIQINLATNELYLIDESDETYIGKYLRSSPEKIDRAFAQGMYINNLLVGYVVVILNEEVYKENMDALIRAGRRINGVIFEF